MKHLSKGLTEKQSNLKDKVIDFLIAFLPIQAFIAFVIMCLIGTPDFLPAELGNVILGLILSGALVDIFGTIAILTTLLSKRRYFRVIINEKPNYICCAPWDIREWKYEVKREGKEYREVSFKEVVRYSEDYDKTIKNISK